MNSADQQLMSIFSAALECNSEAERSAYLAGACGRDAELRARIEALLNAHSGAGGFLEPKSQDASTATPVEAPTITDLPQTTEPVVLVSGRYRLREMIGEGGMGTVWLADQTEPVRRKVALKLIKPGMATREVVGRFEAERQALALMDHPNIAKVHDGGVTDEGRPFFVMELVRGVPVTEYCGRARLNVRERLGLFIQVCQAIQHAHQKGIIHRDLKPSNVLVTEHDPGSAGVVKVIDFGVAKAIGPHLTGDPVHTRMLQMVGTPLYMSPEQAELRGLDVDTRADIYSLGVLLYELLTGTTPFDKKRIKEADYDEVRRIIREEEPPKPSARLSTLSDAAPTASTHWETDPRRLSRECRGELDWMVMKALEKDRNRRYETASAFAADIQRYLNDEPVAAGPPSAVYKVRKFMRRHRGKVVAAGIFTALLITAVVGLAAALVAVNAEKRRKENALTLLTEQQDETKKALDSKSRALNQSYVAFQTLTFDLVESVVARKAQLGESERAYLRKLVTFFEKLAKEHAEISTVWIIEGDGHWLVAGIRDVLGETKEAEAAYGAALAARQRLLDESPGNPRYRRGIADCRMGLAMHFLQSSRLEEAESSLREAVALLTPKSTEFDDDLHARWLLGRSHDRLGLVLKTRGKMPEAEASHREALAVGLKLENDTRALRKNDPAVNAKVGVLLAEIHTHLGNLFSQTNRSREAEAAYRQALALREELAKAYPRERHFQSELAGGAHNLASLLFETGRIPDADAAFRQSIAQQRKLVAEFPLAPSHREHLADSLCGLGTLLTQTGRAPQAEEFVREGLNIRRKLMHDFPDSSKYVADVASAHFDLGNVLQNINQPQEAEKAFGESIKLQSTLPKTQSVRHQLSRSYNNLGTLLADLSRKKEAEAAYREALALKSALVAESPTIADYAVELAGTCCNLGNLFQFHGDPNDSPAWYARAMATLEPILAKDPRQGKARLFLRNSHWGRADTLGKLNRHRDALPDWDRAVELSPPQQKLTVQMGRSFALVRAGEPARATQAIDEILAAGKRPPGVLYDGACVYALASAAVKDETPVRERHATRAVELLAQAMAQGYFHHPGRVEHLKKDDDLATLRERDDFRKLLAELPGPAPPKAPPVKP